MRRVSRLALVLAAQAVIVPAALAASQQLPFKLVSLTAQVPRGGTGTVAVQTAPRAKCVLMVHYHAGTKDTSVYARKSADKSGRVSWTWHVDATATPGTWPLLVHCTDEDQGQVYQAKLETTFIVR